MIRTHQNRLICAKPVKPSGGHGFTLIELVVAIAIIGLLLGALLAPLSTQVKIRKNREATRALNEIQEALIGFAQANGRLPCPDTDSTPDGREDLGGSPCDDEDGILPWVDLGLDPVDTWGRMYRYRVTEEFANSVSTGAPPANGQLDLDDAGDITVKDRASDKSEITLTDKAVAVIVSLGANGYGGRDLDNNALAAPAGEDEQENTDGDDEFIKRGYSPGAASCDDDSGPDPYCEYDDLVKWLPESLLKSRMVAAGRLP